MAKSTMMGNVELLRALRRMGLKANDTQEVLISLKPHDVPTVYIRNIDDPTELIVTLAETGEFNVAMTLSTEDTAGPTDTVLDVHSSRIGHSSNVDTPEVNTANDFGLGWNAANGIVPMLPIRRLQTKQQAYRLAAWLEAMAEMLPDEIPAHNMEEIRTAIRNS
jgi:hypothetical protein